MKKILILLLTISVFSTSCEKFLDVNPKGEVINDDMFQSKQGCEDAVWGLYGQLKSSSLYGEYLNWGFFDALAQNLTASSQFLPRHYLTKYNYNDASSMISELWTKAYEVVGHSNNVIENLEKVSPSAYPLYNLYLGEAYGVRSMLLFDLVRIFAPHVEKSGTERGVPYVTEYSFKHTPFSKVNEVYDFLIRDLKKAQQLLQSDIENITYPRNIDSEVKLSFLKGRQIHFNYYAATALLARVYWTKGDMVNARTEALKVIDSGKFPLASKDEITNLIAGALSPKETIWGIYSKDYFNTNQLRLASGASWSNMTPFQAALGSNYPNPYQNIYSQYLNSNAGVDMRLNWFRPLFDGGTTNYLMKNFDWLMKTISTNTPENRGLIEGISILRSVEMYYIVAESYLLENNKTDAARYINLVLNSRGLTNIEQRDPVIEPSIEMLYNERHKEFFGEGQRWFDMKKKNLEIISNTELKTIQPSDAIYVLPIPVEEFDYRNN
ncbi:MAG: RagB/SusD family nutrient uptake outer membrane protein [Bacteroidales bacterium]